MSASSYHNLGASCDAYSSSFMNLSSGDSMLDSPAPVANSAHGLDIRR
jgi:hypothetical protein